MAFQDEITSANGRVIIVSFGIREFAQRWLQDVHCPFLMVLDPDRKVCVESEQNVECLTMITSEYCGSLKFSKPARKLFHI